MRPLVLTRELEELVVEDFDPRALICQSNHVLGHGIIRDIHDVVVVDKQKFDRSQSCAVAKEVSLFNARLVSENRPYLLIGVGRWGTLDPWLGIPVAWNQISGARAIVEDGFKDFDVSPSQGSHFFHNLTSFMVGYFTVTANDQYSFINWDWLLEQPSVDEMNYTKLVHFDEPITIKMNGQQNKGIILKP